MKILSRSFYAEILALQGFPAGLRDSYFIRDKSGYSEIQDNQSFSVAGARRGFSDPRGTLFFEIARLVEAPHGGHQGERVYSPEGLSCTLAANPGGFGGKTGLYEVGVPIKCATKTGYQMAQVGDSIDLSYATVNSRRGRVGKEIAHTLTTGCQQGTVEVRPVKNPIKSDLARNTERTGKPGAPMHTLTTKDRHGVLCEGRIRRLTPRECLRLQGWADDRIDTVLAIQSDNQAYKQAGNGVTVNVVEAIGRRIAAMDAELRGEALAP